EAGVAGLAAPHRLDRETEAGKRHVQHLQAQPVGVARGEPARAVGEHVGGGHDQHRRLPLRHVALRADQVRSGHVAVGGLDALAVLRRLVAEGAVGGGDEDVAGAGVGARVDLAVDERMALARNHAVLVLEQRPADEAGRQLREDAERDVRLAAAHGAERPVEDRPAHRKGAARRGLAERLGEPAAEQRLHRRGADDAESALGLRRIEPVVARGDLADELDESVEARRKLERAAGRLHAVRAADEQRIPEQVAQPAQRVADGRLAEAELRRHLARAAAKEELAEDEQQAAVDLPDLQLIVITHPLISVFQIPPPVQSALRETRSCPMSTSIAAEVSEPPAVAPPAGWGPALRAIFGLGAPLIAFFLIQNVAGLVCLSFIGGLGNTGLVGYGAANAIFSTLLALMFGFDTGVQAIVARATGGGHAGRIGEILTDAWAATIPLGLVIAAVAWLSAPAVLGGMLPDHAAAAAGVANLRAAAPALVLYGLTIPINACWIASGRPGISFVVTAILAPVQIAITYALVVGVGPLAGLGMTGAGLAGVLTMLVTAAVQLALALRIRPIAGLFRVRPKASGVAAIVAIGWPVSLQQSLVQLSLIVLFAIVARLGVGPAA